MRTTIIIALLVLMTIPVGSRPAAALTTSALLDSLQYTAFRYFWDEANPSNGLVKDRSTLDSPCSIAAVGFGLSATCTAIDHGWVTRTAGRDRILTTLNTFWTGPQGTGPSGTIGYKGLFYHFLDMNTATRTWGSELSSIDTALLFAGVVDARQYFTGSDSLDTRVRALADSITERADWDWMRGSTTGLRMGWKPEGGFGSFGIWVGYNEAMIMYLLALGSPTHPIPVSAWNTWTSGYDVGTFYGYHYVYFPPLFGHQYSHCWVDFRNTQDAAMRSLGWTYFENSRRATLAQHEYCIANPGGFIGYSALNWGLTASDDPFTGYAAHGAPPAQNDNGTIAPTAAQGSIAFAPEVVIPTLHWWYDNFHADLWGPYGFRDAFNYGAGWWDTAYLGIDQGPVIIMIENYRTQNVWRRVMQNADIVRGLSRAGFTPMTGVPGDPTGGGSHIAGAGSILASPNPFRERTTLAFRLAAPGRVVIEIYDVAGRRVSLLEAGARGEGSHEAAFTAGELPSGVYRARLLRDGHVEGAPAMLVRIR